MKIRVGDYVRTKTGKILKIDKIDKCPICKEKEYINKEFINGLNFENTYHKKDIIKHSPNIIDLIEEGDYINGSKVYNEAGILAIELCEHMPPFEYIKDMTIENIITKEQIESIKYEV